MKHASYTETLEELSSRWAEYIYAENEAIRCVDKARHLGASWAEIAAHCPPYTRQGMEYWHIRRIQSWSGRARQDELDAQSGITP